MLKDMGEHGIGELVRRQPRIMQQARQATGGGFLIAERAGEGGLFSRLVVNDRGDKVGDGIELMAGESRRNITTRGVALNHLVGKEFRIGEIRARGLRLCEPCSHLEKLTGKRLIKGLLHRGGLRAQILTAGDVRVGDEITAVATPAGRN